MKYAIIIPKLDGNTKLLADTIHQNLNPKDCLLFGLYDDVALNADIIYLGFWTNEGTCDNKTMEVIKKLTNQKIFLFGSAGFGRKDYLKQVINKVKEELPKTCSVIGQFMCRGKMKNKVKEKYLAMLKEKPNDPMIKMLIANFDESSTHPNENDLADLIKLIKNN